ncbi:hypothetical protein LC593_35680 [Nostoc sp. CHAB 5844]|nr:hypothetical protein [Nostoc sp. CHAB 5844]
MRELTDLNKSLKFRIGDFKALRQLNAFIKEQDSLKKSLNALKSGLSPNSKQTLADKKLAADLQARIKELQGKTDGMDKELKGANKILDSLKRGAFKEINPKWGASLNIWLTVANLGVTTFLIKKNEEIQEYNIETQRIQEAGLADTFTRTINNSIQIKNIRESIKNFDVKINDVKEEILKTEVNANFLKRQINDITYEVRQGRKIVEQKAEAARKLANDALYEVRQGRQILEQKITTQVEALKSQINTINSQFRTTLDNVVNGFQRNISTTIDGFRQQLQTTKTRQEAIDREIASINQRLRGSNQNDNNSIASQAAKIVFGQVDPRIKTIEQNVYGNTIRINTFGDSLVGLGGRIKFIGDKVEILEKTPVKFPPQKNYDPQIDQINARLREQEKVNAEALPKLDSILNLLPLIPARAAGLIKPEIPTLPQIETSTGNAICRSLNGGCMGKGLKDTADNIKDAAKNGNDNLLNKINLLLNGIDLSLLGVINAKLGAQLPGGIAGKLGRISDWLQLDKVLAVLTFAATVHNAVQLSNDIGVTLGTALSNVLSVVGIKNDDGNPIDIGSIINSSVENMVKGIIGAENYATFSTAWAKANRIYQSTTNVINNFTNIGHTIVNGLEVVGGQNGKIGNALRIWGVVGEKAYSWFNPQPNYHSRMFNFFEKAQQGASTIQQVTQVPIDITNAITEFNNSTTELVKAVQQEPNTKDGENVDDAKKVKESQQVAKTSSIGTSVALDDLFNANN